MMERESDDDGATTLIVREYDHGDVPYAAPMASSKAETGLQHSRTASNILSQKCDRRPLRRGLSNCAVGGFLPAGTD